MRCRTDARDEAPGLTSELAAIVVFLLGGMVMVGDRALAVALAVVTSAVLAYKQPLHGLVRRIDRDDLFAGIKLLIASFIVLPLLPDRAIDPWDAINPYRLWLLVIMISALSLVGYVAMRWLGTAHGTAVTGIAGGLVSSTAATLSFARAARTGRRCRRQPRPRRRHPACLAGDVPADCSSRWRSSTARCSHRSGRRSPSWAPSPRPSRCGTTAPAWPATAGARRRRSR